MAELKYEDFLNKSLTATQNLIQENEKLKTSLKELASSSQENIKKLDMDSSTESYNKFNKELKNLEDSEKSLQKLIQNGVILTEKEQQVSKELITLKGKERTENAQLQEATNKLNVARQKEGLGIDRVKQLTRDANQLRKAEAVLNDKTSGTLERLTAENTKLRIERQKLNLETDKGRKRLEAINKAINKNNSAVKKNSDQLKKQKLNVGNYTSSTKDAIMQTGIFSTQVAQLQKIQAVLNIFLKKNTTEKTANAIATKGAAAANGGLTKGLKFLRIALISTGIGAIVVILGSLIAAFASTQRGADAFTKVIEPLKAVFEVFVGFLQDKALKTFDKLKDVFNNPKQAVIDLGNALKDNLINRFTALGVLGKGIISLFKGDFTKGFKELADGTLQLSTGVENLTSKVTNFVEKTAKSVSNAVIDADILGQAIAKLQIKLEKDTVASVVPLAKLKLAFQELKGIGQDQTKTDAQRFNALQKAKKIQLEISEIERGLLDTKIEIQTLENSLNDTSREEEKKLEDLKAEQLEFEKAAAIKINGITSLMSGISKRGAAETKKALTETENFVKELNRSFETSEFQKKIDEVTDVFLEKQKFLKENEVIDEAEKIDLLIKLNEQYQDQLQVLSKEKIENDKKAAQEQIDIEIKKQQDLIKQNEIRENLKVTEEEINAIKEINEELDKLYADTDINKLNKKEREQFKEEVQKHQDELTQIEDKSNEKRRKNHKDALEAQLKTIDENSKEGLALKKEIAKSELAQVKAKNKSIIESNQDLNSTTTGDDKATTEDKIKALNDLIGFIGNHMKERSALELKSIDSKIKGVQKREDQLLAMINSGNAEAGESLSRLRKEEAKLEAEKKKEEEKSANRALLLSGLMAFNTSLAAGKDSPEALGSTISAVLSLTGFLNSLPKFAKGTDSFGGTDSVNTSYGSHIHNGIDGQLAYVNLGERIIPTELNNELGGISNKSLVDNFKEAKNRPTAIVMQSSSDNNKRESYARQMANNRESNDGVNNRLDKILKALSSDSKFEFNSFENAIIKTTEINNKKVNKIKKLKTRR